MNAQSVKDAARRWGADLVGIAPVGRLSGVPAAADPRTLAPETKSVIVVAHRIMRGTLRGVEEGTSFGNTYRCFGFNWMEEMFLSRTVYHLACEIENEGFEAVPLLTKQLAQGRSGGFVPDYRLYAHAAGLGSVGKGGFFLTPQYGHRQRFGVIFTDLELDGDELVECDFCKDCDACVKACPLGAYHDGAMPDLAFCEACRNGAVRSPEGSDPVDRCAASCGRACMVALEGKTGNRFDTPFRKRSVWSIALDGSSGTSGNQFTGGVCPKNLGR